MSENLLSFDTAAGEMLGLHLSMIVARMRYATMNWHGRRRTSDSTQWTDAAVHTLKALGYKDHQYMIVAHDDKKHFHIHVMVNKVHQRPSEQQHTSVHTLLHTQLANSKLNTTGSYFWPCTLGCRHRTSLQHHEANVMLLDVRDNTDWSRCTI